jgi:uncharacterized protein
MTTAHRRRYLLRRRHPTSMLALLWSSAFLAGVAGSGHCVGMCGGIATALRALAPAALPRVWWSLLYHAGRMVSYAIFGALVGGLGGAGTAVLGASPYLRIGAAAVIVLMGVNLTVGNTASARWLRAPERLGAKAWRRVQPLLAARLPQRSVPRALLTGALWGWLPCGLVYSALLAATAAGSAGGGAGAMVAFGLGTVPALAGMSDLAGRLPGLGGPRSRVLGLIVIVCGLWTALIPVGALSAGRPQCEHGAFSPAVRTP